jgi:hypothetical protein
MVTNIDYHVQKAWEGSLGYLRASIQRRVPFSYIELFIYVRFYKAGPCLTRPNLS